MRYRQLAVSDDAMTVFVIFPLGQLARPSDIVGYLPVQTEPVYLSLRIPIFILIFFFSSFYFVVRRCLKKISLH